MKVKEIIKRIEADGWYELPQKATSHRHWKHLTKTGRVTIAGKLSDDLDRGTEKSILKQAGLN